MKRVKTLCIGLIVILGLWATCISLARMAPLMRPGENPANGNSMSSGSDGITPLDTISRNCYADGREVSFNTNTGFPKTAASINPPLGAGDTVILKTQQVAVVGSGAGWMMGDTFNNYSKHPTPFAGSPATTSGDFNGDGRDELMVINNGLATMYTDPFNNPQSAWQHQFTNSPTYDYCYYYLGACDFGGNGTDTLVEMRGWQRDVDVYSYYWVHWEIYDVKNNAPLPLSIQDWSSTSGEGDPCWPMGILTGDFDGDAREELLIVIDNFGYWWLFDDALAKDAANNPAPYRLMDSGNNGLPWGVISSYDEEINALVGDLDGDGRDEVGCTSIMNGNDVYIFDWSVEFNELQRSTGFTRNMNYCFSLTGGDFDGDGLVEFLSQQGNSDNPTTSTLYVNDDSLHHFAQLFVVVVSAGAPYSRMSDVAAVDLNCDGIDEIVVIANNGTTIFSNALQNFALLYANASMTMAQPRLVTGTFTGSGMLLRYTGETSTVSNPPGIMVALAAPPYYAGVDTNLGSTYTGYGISSSESSSAATSIGTTSGWGVTVTGGIDVGGWGFGLKFGKECEDEFASTNTVTNTTTVARKYASGASDDGVIFQITSYDQYNYEVVAHPNATWVGTFLNFQIPRPPLLYKTTVAYFNRAYPEAPKIDAETFKHTVGRPWTYMTFAQASALPHKWVSSWQTVGLGVGANSVEIEVATENSTEVSHSWSSTYSLGGSATGGYGFFSVTVEGEYKWGSTNQRTFTTTLGEEVTFEGSVGDMANANDYALLNHTYGLYVYHLARDNVSYLVLNYYVDGAREYSAVTASTIFASAPSLAIFTATSFIPLRKIVSKLRHKRK